MQIVKSNITPSTITPTAGVGGTAPKGPGRPAGGRDWNALATTGKMPDFIIRNLAGLVAASPLSSKLAKKMPVYLPVAEQKKLMAEALASDNDGDFRDAMRAALTPTGNEMVSLKSMVANDPKAGVSVTMEEVREFIGTVAAAILKHFADHDERVVAHRAELAAAAKLNSAIESEDKTEDDETEDVNESEQGADDEMEDEDETDEAAE